MGVGTRILYRGPLSSCNYGCTYCPFAKRRETRDELDVDRRALERFVGWVENTPDVRGVLFTPWGEALIRPWYHEAFERLTALAHIERVSAQTNLGYNPAWLARCDRQKTALWCTYHPTETDQDRFLARCAVLDEMGVRYSVGAVGIRERIADIETLRARLRPGVYLWVNAFKREHAYYAEDDVERLSQVDPLFPINMIRFASLGRSCLTGESVVSIDGRGDVRRCHFIQDVIGNIYDQPLHSMLTPRACTADTCGCHIGYIYLEELGLDVVFREGILERIPGERVWIPGTDAWDRARQIVTRVMAAEANAVTLTISGRQRQVSTSGR